MLDSKLNLVLKKIEAQPSLKPESEGLVTTSDGVKLRYGLWKSAAKSNSGTIIFLQGRSEFIEKGYETIQEMLRQGFDVVSFDWRGQGGSDRMLKNPRKGFVDEFEDYVIDLETIVYQVALPDSRAPFFIVAHSTGGLVALLSAPNLPNIVSRMVLCSPFLGIGDERVTRGLVKLVTGTLSAVGLGKTYVAGNNDSILDRSFENNKLTSDFKRYERNQNFLNQNPDLAIGVITANWLFSACQAMEKVMDPDFHNKISIPTLFLLAGNDQVVENHQSETLAKQLRAGSSLTVDRAGHELLQERDYFREQCLAAIFSYLPGSG